MDKKSIIKGTSEFLALKAGGGMKKKNLKDRVYEAIMEDIYSGVYKPGDIINEKNLVEKYACSKSPVREALIALCENQVLRNIPRYGYEVTKLTKEDIREMLEFRYYLEGGILYARMGKITPQQIRELEQLNQECLRDDLSPREHWMANLAFHVALIHACGNEYIDQQVKHCMQRLTRAYAQFRWGVGRQNLHLSNDCRHHKQILAALRKKDNSHIVDLLKQDLEDFTLLD